jgi:hypothetical protein
MYPALQLGLKPGSGQLFRSGTAEAKIPSLTLPLAGKSILDGAEQ